MGTGGMSSYIELYNTDSGMVWEKSIKRGNITQVVSVLAFGNSIYTLSNDTYDTTASDPYRGRSTGYFAKFDMAGTLLTEKWFEPRSVVYDIVQGTQSLFYIVGDSGISCIDTMGNITWVKEITAPIKACRIILDTDSDPLVAGISGVAPFLAKYTQSGELEWNKQYPTYGANVSCCRRRTGGFVLTGYYSIWDSTYPVSTPFSWAMQLSDNGEIIDSLTIGCRLPYASAKHKFVQVIEADDSTYIVSGASYYTSNSYGLGMPTLFKLRISETPPPEAPVITADSVTVNDTDNSICFFMSVSCNRELPDISALVLFQSTGHIQEWDTSYLPYGIIQYKFKSAPNTVDINSKHFTCIACADPNDIYFESDETDNCLKFNRFVNHPPTVSVSISDTVNIDSLYIIPILISDSDNDSVSIQIIYLPQGMQLVDSNLIWAPNSSNPCNDSIVLSVSDSIDSNFYIRHLYVLGGKDSDVAMLQRPQRFLQIQPHGNCFIASLSESYSGDDLRIFVCNLQGATILNRRIKRGVSGVFGPYSTGVYLINSDLNSNGTVFRWVAY
jgi:hypothetical protein